MLEAALIGLEEKGEAYLKSKSIYIAPNPWDLAKSLGIYTIIAALGYLIASTGMVWIGYGIMVGSAYFALGETKENCSGNHLEKALNLIKPIDSLPLVEWTYSSLTNKITMDPTKMTDNVMRGLDKDGKTEVVFFKLPPTEGTHYKALIKIYYLGERLFSRSRVTKDCVYLNCNNLLLGEDIQSLLEAANSPNK